MKSKYQLYCTCILCHKETTTQNLQSHYTSKHNQKIYSYCPNCANPIYNKNKFCCKSCSATYNNNKKDYSLFKPGPKKGTKSKSHSPYTKVKQCPICYKWHNKSNTCSKECKSNLLKLKMKQRIAAGWNPNSNRGRGKRSYLERSFEAWLNKNYPNIKYHTEFTFKRFDIVKNYSADFYFPELNLIIELDGSQHKDTKEYDNERDSYISDKYNLTIVRVSHQEYQTKSKVELITSLLGAY